MEDLDIIKIYNSMKNLNEICKKIDYDRANIVSGRAPDEKIKQVANICKCEIIKAYNEVFLGVKNGD